MLQREIRAFFYIATVAKGDTSSVVPYKCLEKSGNLIMAGEWPPCETLICSGTKRSALFALIDCFIVS